MEYAKIKRNLSLLRTKSMPTAPRSVEDVRSAFMDERVRTVYANTKHTNSVPFYFGTVVEDSFGYSLFASSTMLTTARNNINERSSYHIDGTFRVVPTGEFTQLLIFHIEYGNHVSKL